MVTNQSEGIKKKLFDIIERCMLGCVAIHDLRAAIEGFDWLSLQFESTKHSHKAIIFRASVVAYCRSFLPFTASVDGRKRQYPISRLTKAPSFENEIHEHLLSVRHKIIAHFDWTEVQPEFTMVSFRPDGPDWEIPVKISVKSRTITYPIHREFALRILKHCNSALTLVQACFDEDLKELRHFYVRSPDLCRSFLSNLGSLHIDAQDSVVRVPDFHELVQVSETFDESGPLDQYRQEIQEFIFMYDVEEKFVLENGEEISVVRET